MSLKKTKHWWILVGLGLGGLIVAIDFSIVNMVLFDIQKDFSAKISDLQWVMGAMGISFATLLTIMGRLGDILGRRLICYLAMGSFLLWSIGAGLSTSPLMLIIFRFLQGVSCAAIFPTGMSLTADAFPQEKKAMAVGIYGAIFGVGLAIGPVLGGIIVTLASWRWVFFINVPIVILSFMLCLPFLKESKKLVEKIDWIGMTFFILGFGALFFAITEAPNFGWSSPLIIFSFLFSILFLTVFYFVEKRVEMPICPPHLFMNKGFYLGCIAYVAAIGGAWSILFLLPLYLLNILNLDPFIASIIMCVMTGMTVISPIVSGAIMDKKGFFPATMLLFATVLTGLFLMLFFGVTGPLWLIIVAFVLYGWGWGAGNGIGMPLTLSKLPSSENAGIVSGALLTVLNTIAVFLLALIGTIFRFGEKVNLNRFLAKEGITLTPDQEHQVRASLSDPAHAKELLSRLDGDGASLILGHFKESFMGGFHLSIFVLFLFILILFLSSFKLLLQERK